MNSCLYVGFLTSGIVFCSRHPEVKWAQRIDKVYITVQLPDAKDAKVNLDPDGVFTFSGSAGTNLYELKLDLNDKVNVEVMQFHVILMCIGLV
jgi:hypothetical protein